MAAASTQAYANRTEEQDEDYASVLARPQHPLKTHSMLTATSKQDSKQLDEKPQGARVIVSASGMMTGGRVLHHAMRLLPDPNTTLVFVGIRRRFTAAGAF